MPQLSDNLSRQRISQIEEKALRKLRAALIRRGHIKDDLLGQIT